MALWEDGLQYGTRGAQPAASAVGEAIVYVVTDEGVIEQNQAGTWTQIGIAGMAGLDYGEVGDINTAAFGDSAAPGALDEVARADHGHGMPALGTGATDAAAGDHDHDADYAPVAEGVDPTGATDGYVWTADGANGAAWEAVPADPDTPDPTGATDGYVWTADGADGADWEAAAAGGASDLGDLGDVTVSGSETLGQSLQSDGAGGFAFDDQSGGGASVTISTTAPGTPSSGDLWYDSDADVTTASSVRTGTAFPTSPGLGDRYRRSDIDYLIFFYDGTRWLSEQLFVDNMGHETAPDNDYHNATAKVARTTFSAGLDVWLVDAQCAVYCTTVDGSNNVTWDLSKVNTADSPTSITTWNSNTLGLSGAAWSNHVVDIGAEVDVSAYPTVLHQLTFTGAPGFTFTKTQVRYRLIAT